MDTFKNSAASWAAIVGTLLGLIGLIQSVTWLTVVGALAVAGSIGALVYAQRQDQRLKLANLKVAGRSIDSLNMANLKRRLNRSLVIQEAENVATISGGDLTVTWKCSGYCKADREAVIEFSIDSDNHIPFEEVEFFAYDLRHDPNKEYPIHPILVGADGISKKIAVPFLEPLAAQEPFSVLLTYTLPGCMRTGVEYYATTLSFSQERVQRYAMHLIFLRSRPTWLRVYECNDAGTVSLVRDLPPFRRNDENTEYLEITKDMAARSARIYVFRRDETIPLGQVRRAA